MNTPTKQALQIQGQTLGVLAILNVNAPGVTVLDDRLDFGDIQSGVSASSKDTFTIRQDRLFTFNVNALLWNIQASNLSFSTLPDPEKVVVDPNGGIYPVNQLLVNLIDEATRDDAEEIANNVGGKIIGYFPSPNMYQLEVPAVTIEQLESIINSLELDPRVESAFTNNTTSEFAINSDLANLKINEPDLTVAYDNINIWAAWNAIQNRNVLLMPIKVGITDNEFIKTHDEFKNVNLDISDISTVPYEYKHPCTGDISFKTHGTQVAGIIGANNVSASLFTTINPMNGILSGVSNNNQNPEDYYTLILRPRTKDFGQDFGPFFFSGDFESIENTVLANAQIINMSWGSYSCPYLKSINDVHQSSLEVCTEAFDKAKESLKELILKHKDNVLFVTSAGNGYLNKECKAIGVNVENVIPGGIIAEKSN